MDNQNFNNYQMNQTFNGMPQPRSKLVTFLLWYFLGVFGAHRFYLGKVGTGILYLLTAGLFGFGAIFDGIVILCNGTRDKYGIPVKNDLPTWIILVGMAVLVGLIILSTLLILIPVFAAFANA